MAAGTNKTGVLDRVVARHLAQRGKTAGLNKTAGEVRFIKDRGGDHNEWGWNPPQASERAIDPEYKFDAKNLKPLAQTLRSALMALGHIQTARTTFTKMRSQAVSPDGNLGGRGYVMPIKDIRKQLSNCDEALSSITDTLYDEIQAIHWHPDVDDSGGNPRERGEVRQIMDDVDEIREDPEDWAEGEEAEMGGESETGKQAASAIRVASRWLTAGHRIQLRVSTPRGQQEWLVDSMDEATERARGIQRNYPNSVVEISDGKSQFRWLGGRWFKIPALSW